MRYDITIKILDTDIDIVNELANRRYKIGDLRVIDDNILLNTSRLYVDKIEAYLDERHIEYEICRDRSVRAFKRAIVERSGIIVGLIISIIALSIMSNVIGKITIVGNDITSSTKIVSILEDNGVSPHKWKIKDTNKLSDILTSNIPSISYVSCYYRGVELVIDIKDEEPYPYIKKNDKGEVIANYDGIITRCIITSGTGMVKEGDSVKAGDILIAPYKIDGEYEEAKRVEVEARGEIYAKVYLEDKIVIPDTSIRLVDTGRRKVRYSFTKKAPTSPFREYVVRIDRRRLFSYLPIEYRKYTFVEKREEIVTSDDETYTKYLVSHAYERLNEAVLPGEKVERDWIFEKRLDNMRIISVYYEVERLISGGKLE